MSDVGAFVIAISICVTGAFTNYVLIGIKEALIAKKGDTERAAR